MVKCICKTGTGGKGPRCSRDATDGEFCWQHGPTKGSCKQVYNESGASSPVPRSPPKASLPKASPVPRSSPKASHDSNTDLYEMLNAGRYNNSKLSSILGVDDQSSLCDMLESVDNKGDNILARLYYTITDYKRDRIEDFFIELIEEDSNLIDHQNNNGDTALHILYSNPALWNDESYTLKRAVSTINKLMTSDGFQFIRNNKDETIIDVIISFIQKEKTSFLKFIKNLANELGYDLEDVYTISK